MCFTSRIINEYAFVAPFESTLRMSVPLAVKAVATAQAVGTTITVTAAAVVAATEADMETTAAEAVMEIEMADMVVANLMAAAGPTMEKGVTVTATVDARQAMAEVMTVDALTVVVTRRETVAVPETVMRRITVIKLPLKLHGVEQISCLLLV